MSETPKEILCTSGQYYDYWSRRVDCGVKYVRPDLSELIEKLEPEEIEWVKSLAYDLNAAEGREARLKAKLAKAVTRLQHIAANKISDELSVVEWDTHDTFSILDDCILSARTTLAELKGQDDE
jgi:hypothetical protein